MNGTIPEPSFPGDEVLSVNIFAPDPSPRTALPVMVWFHGGAYIAGSAVSPWYDGASFNRRGIVVVAVGYRLGVTGFGLVGNAPANRAVHDWLASLEWVQENIAAFGGDPARVTIAGQSAGGGAVLALLGMERIGTLVKQAIVASPVTDLATPPEARQTINEVARLLGVEPTASAFSAIPAAELADVVWRMRNVFGAAASRGFTDPVYLVEEVLASLELSPVFDGDLICQPLTETARSKAAFDIPLMIGSVAQEFNSVIPATAHSTISDRRALEMLGVPASAAEAYLAARGSTHGSVHLGQVLTDLLIRRSVPLIAEAREHTWVYDFRWPSRGEIEPGLAFHCLDLPFAWGTMDTQEAIRAAGCPPQGLPEEVHGAWASLLADGDPGWESYAHGRAVRVFDEVSATVPDAYRAERLLTGANIVLPE